MNSPEKTPAADVYAGDTSPLQAQASNGAVHHFTIEADAEPVIFARIANVLNIANVAPRRVILENKPNAATLSIYIELTVDSTMAQLIQRKLTQLTEVIHVDLGLLPRDGLT